MSDARDRHSSVEGEEPPVVIRDKRKFDTDGNLRTPHHEVIDPHAPPAPTGPADVAHEGTPAHISDEDVHVRADVLDLQTQLDDRTADLQRLSAEYANYRKRVDRDRFVSGEVASAKVVEALLPVLDDIERAAQHGDLTGPFKAVADKIGAALGGLGLAPFGKSGDPFDPAIHEAVMHDESAEVSEPVASTVMRSGYRLGERLLRPAMVGVTAPSGAPDVIDLDADASS